MDSSDAPDKCCDSTHMEKIQTEVRFTETKNRMVVARDWGAGSVGSLLNGDSYLHAQDEGF
jgi:hypothetical protein